MELPQTHNRPFRSILSGIEDGRIQIPQFQRDFVWSIQKSANVVDSILKGYPIGTFIFWQTNERLRTIRTIGGASFGEVDESESIDFVLDGQQRLTSLCACFKGMKIKRYNGKTDDFNNIFINLKAKENEKIVLTDVKESDRPHCISVKDLYDGTMRVLNKFPEKYHSKIDEYKDRIKEYQYPIIRLLNAPLDVATEVFTRINIGGKSLSLFEIMVAKTFDDEEGFDLEEKYKELINSLHNYDTISDSTVLQTVSLIIGKECSRKNILKIDKRKFIETWPIATDALERAADYFRLTYRIPVSKLLPYNALMVLFAYFFHKHPDNPDSEHEKWLKDLFWRIALTGRYSSAVEAKLAQDVKHIESILNNKRPEYKTPEWGVDTSPEHIKNNGYFSTGRAYIKAILCLYAYHEPKSFNSNAQVCIDNGWLKQANSKNYHHFFPRSYMKKQNTHEDSSVNHILNITIVDDFLNKREIGAKKPSIYMNKFKRENNNIAETMKTHLIPDIEGFGIYDDDYAKFFERRAKIVSAKLNERIIKNISIDETSSTETVKEDDYEEDGSNDE